MFEGGNRRVGAARTKGTPPQKRESGKAESGKGAQRAKGSGGAKSLREGIQQRIDNRKARLAQVKGLQFQGFAVTANKMLERNREVLLGGISDLHRSGVPEKVCHEMRRELDSILKLHEDLGFSITANLGFMDQALKSLEGKVDEQAMLPVMGILQKAVVAVEVFGGKRIDQLTKSDIRELKSTMDEFTTSLRNAVVGLGVTEKMTEEERVSFKKNLEGIKEMNTLFANAMNVLLGEKTEVGEVVESEESVSIPIEGDQGFEEKVKGWIRDIRNANFESATFWTAVGAVVSVIGLAVAAISIIIAVSVLTGGAAVLLGVLGGTFGIIAGAAAGGGAGYSYFSDPEKKANAEQLKYYLAVYKNLKKELPEGEE